MAHLDDEELIGALLSAERNKIIAAIDSCESPIERSLLLSLLLSYANGFRVIRSELEREALAYSLGVSQKPIARSYFRGISLGLFAQYELTVDDRMRRIDMAVLSTDRSVSIAIEADGHAFHERTKEQAANDRSRDRSMCINGWHVLRFTGSEIWNSLPTCAEEVWRLLRVLVPEVPAIEQPKGRHSFDVQAVDPAP